MQLRWKNNFPPAAINSALATENLSKIFPAYHILRFFQIIPSQASKSLLLRFKQSPFGQAILSILVLGFLLIILLHDVVIFFVSSEFWDMKVGENRIIKLLINIRYVLIFWRNCCSIFLMVWKSGAVQNFMDDVSILTKKLCSTIDFKRHSRIFLILYLFPFLLIGIRVTISAFVLSINQPFQMVQFGLTKVPAWAKYAFYYFAEVLGGVLTVAVYVQICALARILKLCCFNFNQKLTNLRQRIVQGSEFPSVTFQLQVRELREFHEGLIDAYHSYEEIFSLQILAAILNNIFIVFSAMASYFVPRITTGSIIVYTLSVISFVYIIILLPFFPIHLGEESEKTLELLQDMIHKREMTCPVGPQKSTVEEFALLTNFVQRATTKPLIITAGGFVSLNRSFVISMGAVSIGWVLFLMERVEGQKAEQSANATVPDAIPQIT